MRRYHRELPPALPVPSGLRFVVASLEHRQEEHVPSCGSDVLEPRLDHPVEHLFNANQGLLLHHVREVGRRPSAKLDPMHACVFLAAGCNPDCGPVAGQRETRRRYQHGGLWLACCRRGQPLGDSVVPHQGRRQGPGVQAARDGERHVLRQHRCIEQRRTQGQDQADAKEGQGPFGPEGLPQGWAAEADCDSRHDGIQDGHGPRASHADRGHRLAHGAVQAVAQENQRLGNQLREALRKGGQAREGQEEKVRQGKAIASNSASKHFFSLEVKTPSSSSDNGGMSNNSCITYDSARYRI
mmetsp:Transcript_6639/g.16894  ORF Transcript_6639/g.16894 Transcript_6639/m.16894 type:complete len:298 (-) Transcript_6639:1001-1894(-)